MKLALTGSTGFVGGHFAEFAERACATVHRLSREDVREPDLAGCDVVVHAAAIVSKKGVAASVYRAINRDLTVSLATMAAKQGVKRFVFVSSVAAAKAATPYGQSKSEAESALSGVPGMEIVTIRPPLVYGWDAKGNIASLLKLASLPLPLPFGSANKKRSLIYIDNLCDALWFAATAAPPGTYTATDNEDVSVKEIVTAFRSGMDRKPMLLPAPGLPEILSVLGARGLAHRLFGEELYASSLPGWRSPHTAKPALATTARNYHARAASR